MLPKEIGQLNRLKLLDLTDCTNLEVIAPDVLSSLSSLEELYLYGSFDGWEVEGIENPRSNASLVELQCLSHLTTLEVGLRDVQAMPKDDMFFGKLERYKISIGDRTWYEWHGGGRMKTSRMLKFKTKRSINLYDGIKLLLRNVRDPRPPLFVAVRRRRLLSIASYLILSEWVCFESWNQSCEMSIQTMRDSGFTVFVNYVNKRTLISSLKEAFQVYGDVLDVFIVYNRMKRKSVGYTFAFVRFRNRFEVNLAVRRVDGRVMDGYKIRVFHAINSGSLSKKVDVVRSLKKNWQPILRDARSFKEVEGGALVEGGKPVLKTVGQQVGNHSGSVAVVHVSVAEDSEASSSSNPVAGSKSVLISKKELSWRESSLVGKVKNRFNDQDTQGFFCLRRKVLSQGFLSEAVAASTTFVFAVFTLSFDRSSLDFISLTQ
ncbi:hypothetical protein F3Y22_tig00116959pilonHSYRG00044 [Hibiscus syriacus]|uniref:RRM domain-containing protein n=1 Tax=Hibiscus syriacus TaxID=106335 RepID=A0A6A2WK73_HIBSY|nr:hypothetical protein F3Y22_tig00116959pilonHSYRG00044 [Hibiscus syriacus]